jgi:carbonic anhydrase
MKFKFSILVVVSALSLISCPAPVLDAEWDYFESDWAPKCWQNRYRMLFMRHRVKKQRKEPVQLELFVPQQEGYEFNYGISCPRRIVNINSLYSDFTLLDLTD